MKKYVVGYMSFFENDLQLHNVKADSELEAVKKVLVRLCSDDSKKAEIEFQKSDDFPKTLNDLKQYYWNADALINVIETI